MPRFSRCVGVLSLLLCAAPTSTAFAQTPFRHQGLDSLHPPDSALPNEQVDPASGTLTVVGTDLVLPGNAGFSLAVQRVYNSSIFPDYASGSTQLEEDSWAGIGWKLHFGRILHADSTSAGQMQIEMGDGSRHALYHSLGNPNIWTTSDFWLYNPATHVLQLPNGRVYTFDRQVTLNEPLGTVRYVTEIRDPFQNRVTFEYFNAPGPVDGVSAIHQYLSATQVRDITFTYDAALKALATMTYLNHTWTYDQSASGPEGFSVLYRVHPPQGPVTWYEYNSGELTAIVAPFGGRIAYTYVDAVRRAGTLTTTTRVVATRTMSGHGVPTGTWTFTYSTGTNQDTTAIVCPCGGTTKYRFNGTGLSGDFTGWSAGTLAVLTVEDAGTVLESRTMSWTRSEAISNDPVSGPNGVWSDTAVYRPLLAQQTTTRGSYSWTTTLSYHTGQGTINDYGHPYFVEEMGGTIYQWRRTTRTFQSGFTPYLLGVVASETLQQNSAFGQSDGTTTSSWTYDLATGFLTSQSVRGFTTTFEPRADGNVNAVVDGRGNRSTFAYDRGRVSASDTPQLDTTSVISPEGLVTSTTTGGLTTTYDYDVAMRLSTVHPPGSNPISYQPDDLYGAFVRVLRGASMVQHDLDAFGREIKTFNSQFLKVDLGRDTCGRVVFTSDPYTTGSGSQGTSTQYDALGRVKRVTDSAGKVTTFDYTGADVSRTDANNRATYFGYMAFGDPTNAQLVTVTDATAHATSYRYDVTGALARVSGPEPGLQRVWTIGTHGLPDSDTQPESGTTTYLYDLVGNVRTVTDANNQTTTLTYDGNNRLTLRDAPGTADDLAATYDAAGRVSTLTSGGTTTTFTYDVPNRRLTRSDATPAGTFSSIYTSDANDNLQTLTYPSGRIVSYHYDAENRLTSFDHTPPGAPSSSVFAHDFAYGDDGRLSTYITGAVAHHFTYEFSRPKRLWTTGGTDALDLTYGYDNVGNVASIMDPRPSATQTFVPDPLDRLDTATGPWGTLHWTYDAAGNRLTETGATTITYTYTPTTQRLASTSGGATEAFAYDNMGQLTSDGVISQYAYSPTGKLTSATASGMSATYAYDATGERFSKTVNGQTTYSLRSNDGQTLTEYVGSCGAMIWSRDLLYAGGQLIGAAKASTVQPSLAMSAATANVNEGAGTVTIAVRLTTPNGAPLGCGVNVSYATNAGTATAGGDFTQTTGTVTFASGSASGSTQSFTVPIISDPTDEANETFTVGLASASGAAIGSPSSTTVTILDDDPPVVAFSTTSVSVAEAAGTATVSVTLATAVPLPTAVSVAYATSDGSALVGQDYGSTSGTVTFPVGALNGATQTFTVPIVNDGVYEPTGGGEVFYVSLSSPSGAAIGSPGTFAVAVVDDDPSPNPLITLDVPADGTITGSHVTAAGWAIDTHAPSGTGITAVQVYAYPNADESQPGILLGTANYGTWRGDISNQYGAQFGPSGFDAALTLPGPGVYRLRARGYDPLGGTWYASNPRDITVQATPRMWLDTPANGTVASWFTLAGWAIDAGAASGTGVDYVHVYAYPNPGSGQPVIFLGTASYGAYRSDVAAAYGAPFGPSGFGLTANLAAGYYQVIVYAHSSVTATWSQAQSAYVTVSSAVVASIDIPTDNQTVGQPFVIGGWAVDTAAASGNGVPVLHIYAYPGSGGPPVFLGAPSTGVSRPDIGAWLQDARFTPSGYNLTVSGLAPGTYFLVVYPYSSVSGFAPPLTRWITVQ
jgi:YD repeat-containing protein